LYKIIILSVLKSDLISSCWTAHSFTVFAVLVAPLLISEHGVPGWVGFPHTAFLFLAIGVHASQLV